MTTRSAHMSTLITYLTIVAGLLCSLSSSSSARTLTPHQLRTERADSIVFLRDANTEKYMGLGVVISAKGHILTAKHVYALFRGADIKGSVGSLSASPKPLKRIDDAPSGADVVLLQFTDENGGVPAPLTPSSKHLKHGGTLRILTGILGLGTRPAAPDQEDIANIRTDVAANVGNGKWQLSGTINVGDSGSPAFDLAGNLIGVVVSGDSSAGGKFHILCLDEMHSWLRQKQVDFTLGHKTDRVVFYVRKNFDASPQSALRFNTFSAILTSNLNNYARLLLPIKPIQVSNDGHSSLEALARILDLSGDDFSAINATLALGQVSAYIRGLDAASVFILLLDLQFGELINIKPVLIELKVDGNDITVAKVSNTDSPSASPDPTKILEPVKELFAGLVQEEPEKFGANNIIFADCVTATWTPWDKSAIAMQALREQLTNEWANTKHRRYVIGSANPASCDGTLREEQISHSERAAKGLAQHLLKASFRGNGAAYLARWHVESRDKKVGHNHHIGDVDLPDKPSGEMILPSVRLLIKDLTRQWDRQIGP
jgi:hypothetical protein